MRTRNPHPLVAATSLRQAGHGPTGSPIQNDPTGVAVHVSKAQFPRALVVMDRLLQALIAGGFEIRQMEGYRIGETRTVAVRGECSFDLKVREKYNRKAHVLTPADEEEKRQHGSLAVIRACDYSFTGRLALDGGWGNVWEDTSKRRLEDRIKEAVACLQRIVDDQLAKKKAMEEMRRSSENERLKAAEMQSQIEGMGLYAWLYRDLTEAEAERIRRASEKPSTDEGFYWGLYKAMFKDEK